MNIKVIENDMKVAWKSGNTERKNALSGLIGAIKKTAIDEGCRDDIPETLVDKVVLKELKTINEQIETCPNNRTDLLAKYTQTRDIISEYAPKQMSKEEVKAYISEKFADVLATKNRGLIMKTVMSELKGKADGKIINQVVGELL